MTTDTAEDAFDRGHAAGRALLLPLCPYPRARAWLREAWRQGVATAQQQQQQLRASAVPANPTRAARLVAAGSIS